MSHEDATRAAAIRSLSLPGAQLPPAGASGTPRVLLRCSGLCGLGSELLALPGHPRPRATSAAPGPVLGMAPAVGGELGS